MGFDARNVKIEVNKFSGRETWEGKYATQILSDTLSILRWNHQEGGWDTVRIFNHRTWSDVTVTYDQPENWDVLDV